jgi:hypothetical protein
MGPVGFEAAKVTIFWDILLCRYLMLLVFGFAVKARSNAI